MELKDIRNKIKNADIGKEKILLLALAGILLAGSSYFENRTDKKENEIITTQAQENSGISYQLQTERKVKKLLESVKQISDATVVITLKSGSEKIVKEDSENTQSSKKSGTDSENSSSVKKTTVILNREGDDEPYVIRENYPQIEGIAVTAKGIGTKKEEIINMLSALLGVPVHKISVLETD